MLIYNSFFLFKNNKKTAKKIKEEKTQQFNTTFPGLSTSKNNTTFPGTNLKIIFMSQDFIISSGFCYEIHKAKPQRFECFGSFVNIIKGIICMGMFVYILAKMNNNHRRALAGYTKNTVREFKLYYHSYY